MPAGELTDGMQSVRPTLGPANLKSSPNASGGSPHDCSQRPSRQRFLSRKPSFRPCLETLEDRIAPAVFNVASSVTDGAAGSLRAALVAANTNGDSTNTINLVSGGNYLLSDTSLGSLLIQDQAGGVSNKTLILAAPGPVTGDPRSTR